jgi:xylulokinase
MYGNGLTNPMVAQISIGTAAQVGRPIGPDEAIPLDNSLNTFEGAEEHLRYQVAAMLNGGLALEWVRERLGFEWSALYGRLEDTIGNDPGGVFFLPYLSGERTPHMNPDARGAWVGLGLHHDNDALAKAALLGVACTVRLGLETLEAGRTPAETVRMVGGSARYGVWRRVISTMLQRGTEYSLQTDGSARGAAYLAIRMLGEEMPPGPSFIPEQPRVEPWTDDYYRRFREVYTALHPHGSVW